MRVYLDMCALKRPFDEQSNNRIWIETQAVNRILELCHLGEIEITHSDALLLENNQNPKPIRRARVAALLASFGRPVALTDRILRRAVDIRAIGFKDMDALHIAFAEATHSKCFVTCDDKLFLKYERVAARIKTRLIDPVIFIKEHTK